MVTWFLHLLDPIKGPFRLMRCNSVFGWLFVKCISVKYSTEKIAVHFSGSALHFSVNHHGALHLSALLHSALHLNAVYLSALQYSAMYYDALQCIALECIWVWLGWRISCDPGQPFCTLDLLGPTGPLLPNAPLAAQHHHLCQHLCQHHLCQHHRQHLDQH